MRDSGPGIDTAKNRIRCLFGRQVRIRVNHGRNRSSVFVGSITGVYPSVFTFDAGELRLSFSYSDVLTGTVKFFPVHPSP